MAVKSKETLRKKNVIKYEGKNLNSTYYLLEKKNLREKNPLTIPIKATVKKRKKNLEIGSNVKRVVQIIIIKKIIK